MMQSGGPHLLNILETDFRSVEVGHPRDLVDLTMVDLPSPSMEKRIVSMVLSRPVIVMSLSSSSLISSLSSAFSRTYIKVEN